MNSNRFLRLRQVEDKIGFGKSWIYRQIQLQQFPPSIRLNSRHVAWMSKDEKRPTRKYHKINMPIVEKIIF